MTEIVAQALRLWGMHGADSQLIAARENAVYKVTTLKGPVALRLHRKGYRSDAELTSELEWMEAVAAGGIQVPRPEPSLTDQLMHVIDGVQVDVLSWCAGTPLSDTLQTRSPAERAKLFFAIGQNMARLHVISDDWDRPLHFRRCAWDRAGLLGDTPLWGRFWENPGLTDTDRDLFVTFRKQAHADLISRAAALDFGLIHADLVSQNIMVTGTNTGTSLGLIDFDDGGFGFRLFEVATALLKVAEDDDFPALRDALFRGYRTIRPLDLAGFDLFMALRAVTYLGWNITRMHEDDGITRNARFIKTAQQYVTIYLAQ